MKTLKEVSLLVGMSRRVIQEYEKYGLAKTPETRNKYGYLLYSDADIERLWQIRFYRELGYEKKQIQEMLEAPQGKRHSAMEARILVFQKKKQELENLIAMAELADQTGITPRDIRSGLPGLENASYNALITVLSTGFQLMKETDSTWERAYASIPDADWEQFFDRLLDLLELFQDGHTPDASESQQAAEQLHRQIAAFLSDSILLLSWILLLITRGSGVAQALDQDFGEGSASFLSEVFHIYCTRNRDNPTDRLFEEALRNIEQLGRRQFRADAPEVQAQVAALHRFFRRISILTSGEQLQLLSILGRVYSSDSCRQLLDHGSPRGASWFIGTAIKSYCKHCEMEESL